MKIQINTNTRSDHDRVMQAFDKKPTAAHLQMRGVSPPSPRVFNGKKNLIKRLIAITSVEKSPPLIIPVSSLYETPEWFKASGAVDVSIIIPLYKSHEEIINQIKTWNWDSKFKAEIIYVDDCCPNSSYLKVIEAWSEKPQRVGKIVINNSNSGYAHACNVGASFASGRNLIFLNADAITTENWIHPMIELLESDDSIGIVGNMQLNTVDGKLTIDSAGSEWLWSRECFEHIGRHSYHLKSISRPIEVKNTPDDLTVPAEREMVTGCCFAIEAELFKSIGGFDINYRIGYWEDSELNMRVKHAGYKVFFQPNSKIYHNPGHSGSGGHVYMKANQNRFFNRWVKSGIIDQYIKDKRPQPFRPSNLLIRRGGAHGDVLAAASIARAIKKQYPTIKIAFETQVPIMLAKHPDITFVSNKIDEKHYDRIIDLDLAYEKNPHVPMIQAYADEALVNINDCKLFMHSEPYSTPLPFGYVVISFQKTNWVGRNWRDDYINELCSRISKIAPIVLIGTSTDLAIDPQNFKIDLRGKTTMHQLAGVIKNSKAFIGIDSLPMWIAQTFKVPGICFFGSILPELRIINDNMIGLNAKSLSCIGCHHDNPSPSVATKVCKMGHTYCEDLITPDMMWDKIKPILEAGL